MSSEEPAPEEAPGGPVAGPGVIAAICMLRYGDATPENLKILQAELQKFREKNDDKPSRTAVDGWFREGGYKPRRREARELLLRYVKAKINPDTFSEEDRARYDELVGGLRSDIKADGADGALQGRSVGGSKERELEFVTETIVRILLKEGEREPDRELADFFYCSPTQQEDAESGAFDSTDQSYYALYRYSTVNNAVLKSFLVLKKRKPGVTRFYSYLNFLRGGTESEPDIVRETTGVILKYESAYHLFGYNYRVSSDRSTDPAGYAARRIEAKRHPRGLELMAIEYDDIKLDRGLVSGVALTVAAVDQPVAARVAMLHLGTLKSLGQVVTDDDVVPDEITAEMLGSDLRDLVKRLQEKGCARFGGKLQRAASREGWDADGSEALAEEIRRMLDNTPAWEMTASARNLEPIKTPRARAAIETFAKGSGRPRA